MTPVLNFRGGAIQAPQANATSGKKLSLLLMGPIGGWWGVTRDQLWKSLKNSNDVEELVVAMATPGGNVLDAYTIHSLIACHPAKTTCYIIGECASAGTIIASAFDKVVSLETSPWMFHQAETGQWGNKQDFRKTADILEVHDNLILDAYKRKTGKPKQTLRAMLEKTTWFTPKQALDMGFVDEIVSGVELDYDMEFVGDSSDDFYWWDSANLEKTQSLYTKRVQNLSKQGVRPYAGKLPFVNNQRRSNVMIKQFAANLKALGLKILNAEGTEVSPEQLEEKMGEDFNGLVQASVRELFTANLESLQTTMADVVALKLQENETISDALVKGTEDAVKAKFDSLVAGLRAEIAQVKNGKRTPAPAANSGAPNPLEGGESEEELTGGSKANKGNPKALLDDMLQGGHINQQQYDNLLKGGKKEA